MNRSSQLSAIILRIAPIGDIHASLDVLTPEKGLVRVMAYGLRSRRGSLKGKIIPFARGTMYLYTDPRREFSKVVDFDVSRYTTSIQQNLTAYFHGNLWAEVVWRTLASGDGDAEVYDLIQECLELLDAIVDDGDIPHAPPSPRGAGRGVRHRIQLLSVVLLWRYLTILGLRPDLGVCAASDRAFAAEESRYYNRRDGVVVGAEWADPAMVAVSPGAVRFLRTAAPLSLSDAASLPVTEATLANARSFVISAIQDAVEIPLNTLRVVSSGL